MIADPYHQSTSTQHMHGSEEVNDNKMKEISGGPREAAELLNTGINHTWDIMGLRGDLQDPVNELEQNRLIRSGGHLKELPQLAHQDTHLGRSERLQLWMWDVQQTLGAQDPIFKEHWDWSWSAGQLLHQEWRGLDISQRSSWTGHRGVPPRFKWTDGFIFEKVRTSVPARIANDLEQRRKAGEKLDVAGLIAELHIHFQPGGVFEAAELTKKISEPNVCQKVAAALGELRAWREKVRRAKMLNITLPDVSIRFMAATSIYKDIFDGEKTSPYLRHKWVNLFNTIDFPERVTEADLIKVNEFAIAQLTDLNLRDCGPGEDGLLSTSQRRRERRREQANKVSGQGQFTSVVNVATDAAVKSSCSSSTSSWALPCRFWHGPKHSCKKGIACLFAHSGFEQTHHESAVHRCVTCGSSSHTTKSCTAPGGSNDPTCRRGLGRIQVTPRSGKGPSVAEDARNEVEEGRWYCAAGIPDGVFTFITTDHFITHVHLTNHTGTHCIDNARERTGHQSFKEAAGPRAQRAAEAGVAGQRCNNRCRIRSSPST